MEYVSSRISHVSIPVQINELKYSNRCTEMFKMSTKNKHHYKFMQLEKILWCTSNILERSYVDFYTYYLILSHKQFTLLV